MIFCVIVQTFFKPLLEDAENGIKLASYEIFFVLLLVFLISF